jgi:tRNA pseudouridine13 synthase
MGHLASNRFTIRLIGVAPGAEQRIGPFFERIAAQGIANYFGAQRFGSGQQNLAGALHALGRGRLGPRAATRGKFLASVIQSEIFNRYTIARVALGRSRVLVGDVLRFRDGRTLFTVDDAEREQARLDRGELRLTGPMVGPKMKASAGEPRELELEALSSLGLDEAALAALGRFAPGTRRDLLLWPSELAHEPAGEGALRLRFTLPAGSYATLVIRTLTRRENEPPRRQGRQEDES